MSLNDSVTLHEPLGKMKKGFHHGGGHHHGGGGRPHFQRLIDPGFYSLYAEDSRSVDDEVAFHEAKHDLIVLQAPGRQPQVRQAVVNALKSRGWIESVKDGNTLLSPPGLVAAMKGLGVIHGLGDIIAPPLFEPAEIMGAGIGGAMVITGVVLEKKLGLILSLVGGLVTVISLGSVAVRKMSTASQASTAAAAVAQQQQAAAQQAAAAPPPPPPPPPKLTSQQRLQQTVQTYGPLAAELVKGIISII